MSQFGTPAGKNPPWARQGQQLQTATSGTCTMQQSGQLQPQIVGQTTAMGTLAPTPTMLQYPQAQIFQQAQIGQMQQQQVFSQLGTVSYPTRQQLNAAAFATPAGTVGVPTAASNQTNNTNSVPANTAPKQRVFTGTVTKVQGDFGFVDEEVFFPASSVVKGSNPSVGDRVLVESVYNATMPFKWNATRVQVLPMGREDRQTAGGGSGRQYSSYNAVPPPIENSRSGNDGFNRRRRREDERTRRDEEAEVERKKRRDERREREEKEKEREREREKERNRSPSVRKRSKSPRRRRSRVVPRYMVQIPKIALDMPEADVMEIRRRYNNLYVPSDFFVSSFRWVDAFPPHRSLTLERPCSFYVMHKDVDPVIQNSDTYDPPDADYLFSAKVMLLGMLELNDLYKRCCSLAEDRDKEGSVDFVHPTRLISFLVGLRGKNETMAIGGPWSPSLDGPNPDKDPGVLIKTAIRNCRALTGIDLSHCTQWFRFLEIYYRRAETVHKGKTIPARVETVVLFLPDVWNCLPTRLEWDGLQGSYKKLLDRKLNADQDPADDGDAADEKDGDITEITKKEPTHYSQLDPKTMKVSSLREELEARALSPKGLKSQLIARLVKALKTEQEFEEAEENDETEEATAALVAAAAVAAASVSRNSLRSDKEDKEEEKKRKEDEERKKNEEKDRLMMEKRYTLPENPHILVHPSRTARSGKFDCTVMSLSLLLDYRQEDTKEHSFEVSLFAELFNEMLMRDFGFRIYRALVEAPEKPKEEKEEKDRDKKEKEKDKKSDSREDKKDRRDKDDKRDEKRDDKRDEKKDDKRDRRSVEYDDDDDDYDDDDDRKDKKDKDKDKDKRDNGRKKRDRIKMVTEDPYLLLSFVYFDQTHCGYIFDKDVEELLFTLGLNLSRAQVKKLVQKVVTRDSLHYRKLTDKSKQDEKDKENLCNKINGEKTFEDIEVLGLGNKKLLPVFCSESGSPPVKRSRKDGGEKTCDDSSSQQTPSSGFVMYKGSLLDLEKLTSQLKRSEAARLETEKCLAKARHDYASLKDVNSKLNHTVKDLTAELKDFKERLTNTNSELCNVDAKTKLYFTTLTEIHEKITPLLHHKMEERDETIETVEMVESSSNSVERKSDIKEEKLPSIKKEKVIKDSDNVTGKVNMDSLVKEEDCKKELVTE
ncbi:cell division cycle and apoptosis regulator protein 1-like isoform X2 [Lycorma delicatula]|uniref:cell division cycle and apoptosis regulator protein 1-like isoform X2 n=1 Tax=Lycorma delicatula TaxID=130591 RepID=UPI003F518385